MSIIPIIAGVLGGTALGSYLSNQSGSELGAGFIELGTSKKLTKTQDTYQYSYNISETIANTLQFQPMTTISPTYSYNPITIVGSREIDITKKETYAQALKPSWDLPIDIETTSKTSQSAEQLMGGSGYDNIISSIKQFALIGVIGFIVYKVVVKK